MNSRAFTQKCQSPLMLALSSLVHMIICTFILRANQDNMLRIDE